MVNMFDAAMVGLWCSVIFSILFFNNAAAISKLTIPEITQDNFQQRLKEKKCMFLYATEDNCEKCTLLYNKFVTVSQTFGQFSDISFGQFSDRALVEAFDIKDFPAIVFYEFGNAVPKTYLGDLTVGAMTELVAKASKENAKSIHTGYSVQLTKENFDGIIGNDKQYRLVMLHEADDEDEITAFDEIAQTFDNEAEVALARINVDAEKYLDNKYFSTLYPSFYWYPKGSGVDKKKRYGGELRVDQMISFLNKQTGLQRMRGGGLTPFSGLIKPLDDVLDKHGKSLFEVRYIDEIKKDIKREIKTLPKETDKRLPDYYLHLLDELEEDGTIETLGESRARLHRQMADRGVGPLTQDLLVRKRNIVQKFIDIIGKHMLAELSNGDVDLTAVPDLQDYATDGSDHGLEFHDEF